MICHKPNRKIGDQTHYYIAKIKTHNTKKNIHKENKTQNFLYKNILFTSYKLSETPMPIEGMKKKLLTPWPSVEPQKRNQVRVPYPWSSVKQCVALHGVGIMLAHRVSFTVVTRTLLFLFVQKQQFRSFTNQTKVYDYKSKNDYSCFQLNSSPFFSLCLFLSKSPSIYKVMTSLPCQIFDKTKNYI